MDNLSCPICDSNSLTLRNDRFNNYDLYTCNDCKVIFCVPFKAHDAEFYSEADDILSENRHKKLTPWFKDHPSRKSDNLKNGTDKTLLDIGCGDGPFVEFAAQNGFHVVGIDFDTTSLIAAKRRNFKTEPEFINTDLEDYYKKNPGKKFDIITAFEVIEHLDNPKRVLKLINLMLKPGGLFIGTLPNFNRILIKKINMIYEIPPYHLTYWTSQTWKNVLEAKFGFKEVLIKNDTYCGYMSYQLKHKYLSLLGWENKKNIGSVFLRTLFIVTGFFEIMLEKLLDKGGSFYFEMRKV